MLADLTTIRKDGFWVARSEIFSGAIGIAAPYFDHSNKVAGSIIVYGPDVRFGEQQIANTTRLVIEGATEISAALGHAPPRAQGVRRGAPIPKRWASR